MEKENCLYKITFNSQEKVFEIFAQKISHSELPGFLAVEGLLSGERRTSENRISWNERRAIDCLTSSIKCSYIPVNSIIRIDELEEQSSQQFKGFSENKIPHIFEAEE